MANEGSSIPAGSARAAACYARLRKSRPGAAPKEEDGIYAVLKEAGVEEENIEDAVQMIRLEEREEEMEKDKDSLLTGSPPSGTEAANPSVMGSDWPELDKVELPKHLRPAHERDSVEELEELLSKP